MRHKLFFMNGLVLSLIIFFVLPAFLFAQSFTKATVALTGDVYNEITKKPVSIIIEVYDNTGKRIMKTKSNSFENGYYFISGLKPGEIYTVYFNDPEFFKDKQEIAIPNSDKYLELSKDFLVKPLTKGLVVPFTVSPFELNKSKLRYGAGIALDDILSTLKENPGIKFEINCFPDNNNSTEKNLELTTERATSIADYFMQNGIDKSRITTKGEESTDPSKPLPVRKRAKGKRYIGPSYITVLSY